MPDFGFVIDNRKCIGCHACTTACKSENEVPLGVNRTWVKYVEAGAYPHTRRHFQVTRCNHCANPPCVRICPVTAMYQRADGIVEFDASICIGCKACMQACPYDAIYIDPDSGTAAKCHFCAHRTELGLEPACVVVCPTHAIISGDMADPRTEIHRVLAEKQVTVRKPEQGTAPKLFYIDGSDIALHPTAVGRVPASFMWADAIPLHPGRPFSQNRPQSGNSHQGLPSAGPIQLGGKMAEHMVQVAYNAQHKVPWHWPVPAYLVTKGIGAGIFMILSLGAVLGLFPIDDFTFVVAGFLSLLFIALTTGLLVLDLERPERFLSILFRPQWQSWLTRGAFILVGFSGIAGLWWLIELGALSGWWGPTPAGVRAVFLWVGFPLAAGVAFYSAFLFGQAEGRDLWQSTLLPGHLLLQALLAGSGVLLLASALMPITEEFTGITRVIFVVSLFVDLFVVLFGEFGMPHASEVAARAAHDIRRGRYKRWFWWGSLAGGHVLPLLLLAFDQPLLAGLAGLAAIAGLYAFEYAFVMAPQEVPNS